MVFDSLKSMFIIPQLCSGMKKRKERKTWGIRMSDQKGMNRCSSHLQTEKAEHAVAL